ncbi:DnaJ subfamily A member 2 [Balamuthia mandrillaris]
MGQDFYELLGIAKDADEAAIKKAYRKLALKYHPDRNPGNADAETKFKELSYAYEVLSDPQKRKIYDQYGEDGLKQGGGFSSAAAEDIFSNFFSGFGGGDPFGGFFGRGRRAANTGPKKTKDVVYQLPVSLVEFYNGRVRKLKLRRSVLCPSCDATGSKHKKEPQACTGCKGKGIRVEVKQMGPGFISQTQTTCPLCKGEGKATSPEDRCPECKGERVVEEPHIFEVNIEKGARPGEKVVFEGEADEYPGAIPGDVIVVFVEKEEPTEDEQGHPNDLHDWQRANDDLIRTVHISLRQALCGYCLRLKHLDGRTLLVRSSHKDVIRPGDIRMVPGEGMPDRKTQGEFKGNLYLKFEVDFPTHEQIKDHMKELRVALPVGANEQEAKLEEEAAEKMDVVNNNKKRNKKAKNGDHQKSKNGDKRERDAETSGDVREVTAIPVNREEEMRKYKKAQQEEDREENHQGGRHGCVHQ